MEIRDIANEVLQDLFDGYVEHGGSSIYDINDITGKHGVSAQEMGTYLLNSGLIKHQTFLPGGGFTCAISIHGINYIAPRYFPDLIDSLLIPAGLTDDWVGIIESTSSFGQKDYQRAFDIGKVMQEQNLAEIQNYPTEVHFKLTLRGKEDYNRKNQGGFIQM
jgi:hypothetical protein